MPLKKLPPPPPPRVGTDRITLLPDELRLINLYGVDYYIPWESMPIGSSVFLKTTAEVSEVNEHVIKINKHFRCTFAAQQRCEYGYFGIRIWRIS